MAKFLLLFVDDEEAVLSSIRRSLKGKLNDWQLFFASSGKEALVLCAEHPFDLIVTDAGMPNMTGGELIIALQQEDHTKDIPVIMLTGNADETVRKQALENGVIEFLYKPILPAELVLRIKNILNLKRLNNELKELNEQKNHFLGIAAHDLRNPLHCIMSIVGLYQMKYQEQLTADQAMKLAMILKEVRHMNEIITDFLDVSAIEAGQLVLHRQPVNIQTVFQENLKIYEELAYNKNIVIDYQYQGVEGCMLCIDPNKICQAVGNLLSNAIKYSPAGSKITCSVKKDGDQLSLSVQDHGQGIPEDEQQNLFTPFGKTSVKATAGEPSIGLGLAIVKKIIETHGGRVEVLSKASKGSIFTVVLPLLDK